MADISCPACRGTRLERYGKTAAGRQKYRCLVPGCRRQFVSGSDHFIAPETKDMVIKLLDAGVHPTAIADAIRDISLRWIYELKKRMKLDVGRF